MMFLSKIAWELLSIKLARKSLKQRDVSQLDLTDEYLSPGQNTAGHNGFVNSLNNASGLQAKFFIESPHQLAVLWERSEPMFEGFPGIIHGGISSSLVDELMANTIVASQNRLGVTLKLKSYYHAPIRVGEKIYGRCNITRRKDKIIVCEAFLFNEHKRVTTTSVGLFLTPSLEQFKKLVHIDIVPEELRPYLESNNE